MGVGFSRLTNANLNLTDFLSFLCPPMSSSSAMSEPEQPRSPYLAPHTSQTRHKENGLERRSPNEKRSFRYHSSRERSNNRMVRFFWVTLTFT
jgi:hypothetical protein